MKKYKKIITIIILLLLTILSTYYTYKIRPIVDDELYNFAQPYAKMITMNGKYYIGIYTQDETSTNK